MQKRELYKELLREYDKKRLEARKALDARRSEVYELAPRIKEIDAEIAEAGFKMTFLAIENPEKAAESAKKYKEKCRSLINEKNAILKEKGIPKKYLEMRFECRECQDTGYVGNTECRCFKQKRIGMAYNSYLLKDRLNAETFDNFDFRYYSSKESGDKTHAPKKNMERIVKYCMDYVKNFDKKRSSLLFYGKPGLGKTFLCNSIARELMDEGRIVVYITAFKLFETLGDIQFGRISDEDRKYIMDDILNSDLLIIDDVGTELSTVLTGIGFFNIINSRALAKRPVIVSTNLYPDELKDLYSERIYSRIIGDYTMFEFYGEDIRTLKKFKRFLD